MDSRKALAVARALGWLTDRLAELPEDQRNAFQASLTCRLAQGVVTEFAERLARGEEPYDALRHSAESAAVE